MGKNKTCKDCIHFCICKIIDKLIKSLKRHIKIFKPTSRTGPTDKMYRIISEECIYFRRKEDG